ncbi:DUF4974 domain-containing protein [Maribellus luteus]|uniref:DUF4974 domain-containing protein n=1 Tax=Maribellus luteus TaxID=2305463 RepID=A0A399T0L0_9BACT|nr:FecR domain-containing protein [Maribellus luteus]RIJ49960.1 DUF4974 domain-containing protein [Maribellus luteus]
MKNHNNNILLSLKNLIYFFKKEEITTSADEKKRLWNKVVQTAAYHNRRKKYRIYTAVATAAALSGAFLWFEIAHTAQNEDKLNTVVAQMSVPKQSSDIIIMVSDSNEIHIDKDTAVVNYSGSGEITINNQAIATKKPIRKKEPISYNQIIVPGGKRTMLTLSDSTKIWINAGSRVIFPQQFEEKQRKIYVEGEAYLEVAKNAQKPFIVETPAKFDIRVLGTSFNVCTYSELNYATVVLAEGKIELQGENKQQKIMAPNQLVRIDATGAMGEIIEVDAHEYTSWTQGLLVLNSQPFTEVLKRLEIYFGVSIKADEKFNPKISGELELKDQLEDILTGLQNILPYRYSVNEEGVYEISTN